MAHFAKLNSENIVEQVIVINNSICLDENNNESEQVGADFCANTFGGNWKQTSYNGNFRKNFASVGFTYDSNKDAFIPPKPYIAWVLNEDTCLWEAPSLQPEPDLETGTFYHWDSDESNWMPHTIQISEIDSA